MRPDMPEVLLRIAMLLSQRATCAKLSVGCVLVDDKYRIIGTGYNGTARSMQHCTDKPCAGALAPKGSDLCEAVHAEQNALLNCREPDKILTAYITHAPCMRCTKLLLNTECKRIVFVDDTNEEPAARELWQRAARLWFAYGAENVDHLGR